MTSAVWVVGAGSGDPDLLTRRAHRLLQQAEVVAVDLRELPRLAAEIPATAERLEASALSPAAMVQLLGQRAAEGRRVVRLLAGDPFLLRGIEECLLLAEAGIRFQVVPAVPPVMAALTDAGIPLVGGDAPLLLLAAVPSRSGEEPVGTVSVQVIPAPGQSVEGLLSRLAAPVPAEEALALPRGLDGRTPAIALAGGRVVAAPLGHLPQAMADVRLSSPGLVIAGEAVRLRQRLAWRERLPLAGARVLITRARHQAGELAAALQNLGAETIELPLLTLQPPEDPAPLEQALLALPSYEWLLFTSVNAVEFFFQALFRQERDVRDLYGIRLVAIGPATAESLRGRGLLPSLIPEDSRSEGILAALRPLVALGERVLLPRAQEAREVLPRGLREMGLHVDGVAVYRNAVPTDLPSDLPRFLEEAHIHWLPFASSSAAERFATLLQGAPLPRGLRVAAIGPVTAARARELGLPVEVVAERTSVSSLVDAMAAAWKPKPKEGSPWT